MVIKFAAAVGLLAIAIGAPAQNDNTHRDAMRPRPDYGAPSVPGSRGLANSLFILRERGGFAHRDRQTVVRLMGRVLQPGEIEKVRDSRDVQVPGPVMRKLEKATRDSGFMNLNDRYKGRRVADGMTRTIRVTMQGKTKSVSVDDGARVPPAFEAVWKAARDARAARGSVTK
jgi:hypothetical protein